MTEVLRLLNRDRDLVGVLDKFSSYTYERRLSSATQWSVSIPLNDIKQDLLDVAHYVEIMHDDRRVFIGKITARDIGPETVTASGFSEEIELERAITPAQYGIIFSNQDLALVAEELCWDRAVVRIKDKSEWEDGSSFHNIDFDTEPGLVILAKAGGKYVSTGHMAIRFDKNTIPGFTSWERIRWASDNEWPVFTTMQYRYANDLATLAAASYTTAVAGVLPDEIGVIPAASTQRYLEVRINLTTEDTTSDGIGFSPALYVLEVIAKTRQLLDPSELMGATGETVNGLTADNDTHLAVLQAACNQLGYEFVVEDGVLRLAKELSTDRTSEFVLRAGDNIDITSLGDTDEDLVNVLTAYGPGAGLNRWHVVLEDEDSIAAYGRYPASREFSTATTKAELVTKAQEWLDEHSSLRQSYRVTGAWSLEEEPEMSLGDMVLVADPLSGVVGEVRVLGITRQVDSDRSEVELDLGTPAKSLVDAILDDLNPTRDTRLALAVPVGLRATPASPGITVSVNPYVNSRSAGVEVHMSETPSFTASSATVVGRGQATSYVITGTVVGNRYYFKARSYDDRGEYSNFTSEVSTLAGGLAMDDVSGTIDLAKFAEGLRPILVGTDLPALPDPTNVVVGDMFALYDAVGGNPILYVATDTNSDGFADYWKPAINTDDLTGFIAGNRILANTIDTAQLRAGAVRAQQIAAEEIGAEHIGSDEILARHIDANTINARHIRIGDTSNVVSNPALEDADGDGIAEGWSGVDQLVNLGSLAGNPAATAGLQMVEAAGNNDFYYGNWFPATEGDTFYVSAWVRKSGSPNADFRMGLQTSDMAFGNRVWPHAFNVPYTVGSGWRFYEGYVTVPSSAARARLWGRASSRSPAQSGWMFTAVTLRRATDTRLLVDGSIELTNADKTNAALKVLRSNNAEVLRLGRISGLPTVPNTVDYGLWGTWGTGVFIQGLSRLLRSVQVLDSYAGSSMPHPSARNALITIDASQSNLWTPLSYRVPEGRMVNCRVTVNDISPRNDTGGGAVTNWDSFGVLKMTGYSATPSLRINGVWRSGGRAVGGDVLSGARVLVGAAISTVDRTVNPVVTYRVTIDLLEEDDPFA